MWMVLPSVHPSFAGLSRNPASSAFDSASCAGVPISTPIRGIPEACRARAASGQATALLPLPGPRDGMVAGRTGSLEVVGSVLGNVRFGSKAVTPKSGHLIRPLIHSFNERPTRRSRASRTDFVTWAKRLTTWRFGKPQKSSSFGQGTSR